MKDFEKDFLGIFKTLCYSRSSWQVWADLITAMACSLANVTDRSEPHYSNREKEYKECIKRIGGVEKASECFAVIVAALETDPDQDFLGKLYMNLELGNHWKGQFFTPYNVCRMMAEMQIGDGIHDEIGGRGYISICDPACGAGATLIAAANTIRRRKANFQTQALFVGQDIDRVTGMMCYIQLSLLGCAGYVCIGNTLTNPLTGSVLFPEEGEGQELWYMPMYMSQIWTGRRKAYMMNSYLRQTVKPTEDKKAGFTFFFNFEKEEVVI